MLRCIGYQSFIKDRIKHVLSRILIRVLRLRFFFFFNHFKLLASPPFKSMQLNAYTVDIVYEKKPI